ncbi:MAG: FKBP-type peptidyl-prolyl cis-trans isomerase [Oscillospiraceae bacterium]|nr:FKBP-type peptidyl-prolyl cis-trans isomerase [Oscillospiraceae bacterium]
MRIAVTYENGEVFQHFGHTEQFKVYNVEDGNIVSAEVIGTDGSGHEALADLLHDRAIDVLICGGIGGGAQAALEEAGIELCAGASGSADKAAAAYLRGELINTGANCDHHDEEHADGEHSCGGSCGSEEGGCQGCRPRATVVGKNVGRTCRVHYRGTFDDGTQFDSSYDRGEPLEFVCGAGTMILGFDSAVADMDVGQTVQIHLMPFEAYGDEDPRAFIPVKIEELPGSENLSVGEQVYLQTAGGQPFKVRVESVEDGVITFNANHEMAGKELNFTIELLEIVD